MSFYDNQAWSQQGRQPSWEQPAPPSRSGATSSASNEPTAFMSQIEEVDKAMDDLAKSGKLFGGPGVPLGGNRRESMPAMNRGYSDNDHRSSSSSRHHSVHEHDGSRSGSAAGLQGFYASQRFQPQQQQQQPPRQSEAEQMMQAKRRMAAQRERELRNYHQEQQYNRNASASTVKPDRSSSPNTMNEDDRRELIARQHRALYGNEPAMYSPDGTAPRQSQDSRLSVSGSVRGSSPLAFENTFGSQPQAGAESAVQMPPRELAASIPDRRTSASPAVSNPPGFSMAESLHQSTRTAGSPSNNSPSIMQGAMPPQVSGGVAPIGTRPSQSQNTAAKRSITPNSSTDNAPGLGSWGPNSGVWGSMNTKSVQASVWG